MLNITLPKQLQAILNNSKQIEAFHWSVSSKDEMIRRLQQVELQIMCFIKISLICSQHEDWFVPKSWTMCVSKTLYWTMILVTSQSKSNEHTLSLHIKIDSNFEWFPVFHGSCCYENGQFRCLVQNFSVFFFSLLSSVYEMYFFLKNVASNVLQLKENSFYIRYSTHSLSVSC